MIIVILPIMAVIVERLHEVSEGPVSHLSALFPRRCVREAEVVLKELIELNERRYVTPAALVHVYTGLGDKDQAFVWMEKAYQERSNFIAYLKVVPIVDPLRSDPRFDDLLRRVGLRE